MTFSYLPSQIFSWILYYQIKKWLTTFITFSTCFLTGSSDHNSGSSNFDEIISNLGAAADQVLDENQLKYLIGLLRDKINMDEKEKNLDVLSEINEDFHGFSDVKPHIHVPEIVPETVSETISETVPETVPEIVPGTAQWWASYKVSETISKTIPETVLETVSESVTETTPEKVWEAVPLTVTVNFSDTIPNKPKPKNHTRTCRRRKPKWLRTTTTNVGWNTPTGFYYNQTS